MPRKKRPPEPQPEPQPTKKPVYVFDLNPETGVAEVNELSVIQEPEPNQTRFGILSGDLTRAVMKLLGRANSRQKPHLPPGA